MSWGLRRPNSGRSRRTLVSNAFPGGRWQRQADKRCPSVSWFNDGPAAASSLGSSRPVSVRPSWRNLHRSSSISPRRGANRCRQPMRGQMRSRTLVGARTVGVFRLIALRAMRWPRLSEHGKSQSQPAVFRFVGKATATPIEFTTKFEDRRARQIIRHAIGNRKQRRRQGCFASNDLAAPRFPPHLKGP